VSTSATDANPDLTGLSLRAAGDRFRDGSLSPTDLTAAVLARIERTEPTLHAYVSVFGDEAMAAARRAEAELRAGTDRGPLLGIPVGIKDIFDVAGVPTLCGSLARAVLLGKTVTQEFAAGVISAPARNPWDPARIPGGSSGGSAAAVAVGSAVAALGSDTGGSIRIPASVTGIVGLKPTYGLLPTRGVFPLSWALDTVGPLARTVEDAALLLDALAGRAAGDPDAVAAYARVDTLRGVRIGVSRPHFFDRLQPGVAAAVEVAIGQLTDLGAEVVDTPWLEAAAARAVGLLTNRIETVAVHEAMARATPERLTLLNPDLRLRLEAGVFVPATVYLRAGRARGVVKRTMARLFGEHRLDALLAPTLPGTAVLADHLMIPYPDGEEAVNTGYTRLTMPFNATGQPVLALPCGFDEQGLPVGLQLAGRPFAEAALCRIGHAYERATGWHRLRPPLAL